MPLQRIPELDWLKGLMIVLMVAFHLVWFTDLYPYAKSVVYTFHMPVFLLVSGFLCNTSKAPGSFLNGVGHIFLAYIAMEAGYAAATTFFDVRESIGELSVSAIADAVFLHPIGPYWYLHTYVLCMLICYASFRLARNGYVGVVLAAVVIYCADRYLGLMWDANGFYFLFGAAIRYFGLDVKGAFEKASPWALLPVVLLCASPDNLNRGEIDGIIIVFSVLFLLVWLYRVSPARVKGVVGFLGRNTLPVLLFSPVFTMLSKFMIPIFGFDGTRLCYMVISVVMAVAGSLAIGYIVDKLQISSIFAGRKLFVYEKS